MKITTLFVNDGVLKCCHVKECEWAMLKFCYTIMMSIIVNESDDLSMKVMTCYQAQTIVDYFNMNLHWKKDKKRNITK